MSGLRTTHPAKLLIINQFSVALRLPLLIAGAQHETTPFDRARVRCDNFLLGHRRRAPARLVARRGPTCARGHAGRDWAASADHDHLRPADPAVLLFLYRAA